VTGRLIGSSTGESQKPGGIITGRAGSHPDSGWTKFLYQGQAATEHGYAFLVMSTSGAELPSRSDSAVILYQMQPNTEYGVQTGVQRSRVLSESREAEPTSQFAGWVFPAADKGLPLLLSGCLPPAGTVFPPSSTREVSYRLSKPNDLPSRHAPEVGMRAVEGRTEYRVEQLFQAARDECFEDGMESSFSEGLTAMVESYGHTDALKELLAYWLLLGKTPPHVTCEALRCLGRASHTPSHRYRRWLLERCLKSPSPAIRDASALGLSYLDDADAVPSLAEAAQRENIAHVREGIMQVLAQFQR
jgi:hypothetical protein